jgi:acyl-CoA synthetase (AMP-forming)/AMP-acid ligase II
MTSTRALVQPPPSVTELDTLIELLQHQAASHGDRNLYTFLADGETEEASVSFADLDRRARAIAAALQESNVYGQRALLLYPPGLEFINAFFGCLYAGVIAVPVYPPNPARPNRGFAKFLSIAANCRPVIVLTTSSVLGVTKHLSATMPDLMKMRWMASDAIPDDCAEQWAAPSVDANTLAFLQYTSGSTASPKGVMVSHGNLLHNESVIYSAFEHNEECRGVSWLPVYHDMGLIGTLLQPLYAGYPFVLMSPVDFLQRPLRWLKAISRYRANVSGGPNFAYDLCVRKISEEQKQSLDLSCWDLAFNGAEPVKSATMKAFSEAFQSSGFRMSTFYPCYGLAEGTLFVTGGIKGEAPITINVDPGGLQNNEIVECAYPDDYGRILVSCGTTHPDQKLIIVDPQTLTRCDADTVGEIWVSSPSVCRGYWELPDDSEQTFHAYLADTCEGPFLRTGDLGFIKNGELFVTGRCKDLIIANGINYYPQDIEATVERAHPGIRSGCCASFAVEVDGQEKLVIVAEIDRRYQQVSQRQAHEDGKPMWTSEPQRNELQQIVDTVRKAVSAEHDLPLHRIELIKAATMPKTSSGKIQRHACKDAFLHDNLDIVSSQ